MSFKKFFLLGFLWLSGCSSLLYYPTSYLYVDLNALKIKPEEVMFTTPDGTKHAGWYFRSNPKKLGKAQLVFFHGNGQNLSAHFIALYWILDHGYDFFIFDYPGYGGSQGEPTPKNTVTAGVAALRWAKAKNPTQPLVVFGQSLGGAVALSSILQVKDEISPCLIVAESSFTSYQRAGKDVLSNQWWTWLFQPLAFLVLSDSQAPRGKLKDLSPIPLLVIHGDKDPVVAYKRGEELFKEAGEPKEFWQVPGGQHIDTFGDEQGVRFKPKFLAQLGRYCK